ncbi:acyl transferase domain-containing protein [Astrocystis sublimbata]|nr:acyl transferase domain-containing protein [Astrocystis sublimbata]
MIGCEINGHKLNDKRPNSEALNGVVPNDDTTRGEVPKPQSAGPFVLSANSSTALAASVERLASYLRANPETNLDQLAYTLFRRTDFPFRAAFSATRVEQLIDKLEAGINSLKNSSRIANIPETLPPRILGIFTGQGARWATMGKELYGTSTMFRDTIDHMQKSLDSLDIEDRPDWRLIDQLEAPAKMSRVSEAAVSQPLCTALQIGLVEVLRAAGIEFAAVVGHSSGEIAAAYAAGYLDVTDAIRIAYYRGVHAHLAKGPGGKRGKMMAVGMSLGQATVFCDEYDGAITVAASNSQTSCTIAGDTEAIDEAHARLSENGIFVRVLNVDTAYHSSHMKPCSIPYLKSLKQCGITVHNRRKQCKWYSSVWGANGRIRSFDQADSLLLEGQYWVDNMTQTVYFKEALSRALNEDQCFDLVLEVGPHPALKSPSSETIQQLTSLSLPYSGILKRGQNAVESFCDALGLFWKLFPSPCASITFDKIRHALSNSAPRRFTVLKSLAAYPWDHRHLIWKESRSSRIFRAPDQAPHELLGSAVVYGDRSKREVHWKQLLRLSELPWLGGHRIQGEVLFPASGFLSMTYEAAIRLVENQQSLQLVELHDIAIARAMRLEEDSSGLEVVFVVRVTSQTDECITAEVTCYSDPVDAVQPLDAPQARHTSHFTGSVRLWLGDSSPDALPRRAEPLLPMDSLDMKLLYSSLAKEGFNYTEPFQATSMLRRLNRAVVTLPSAPEGSSIRACMHPASVDTAFQGLLAGFSFPGDGRLGSIYLPTRIDCVRISMSTNGNSNPIYTADANVTSVSKTSFTGNVDLFDAADGRTDVQIRGIQLTAVGQRRDPWLYAGTTWVRDIGYGIEPGKEARLSEQEQVLYEQLTRTSYFYLRQLRKKISKQEIVLMGKHEKHMMTWILEHLLPEIEAGEHPEVRPEWKDDTLEMVQHWRDSQSSDNNDMNILHAMGKNLVSIVRGITPPLKVLTQDGMLDRLYVEGLGSKDGNVDLDNMIRQLAHQHPRMNIIEIGAGTGGTTRAVVDALGNNYASYTYTDISTGFFDNARAVLAQHIDKFKFKTLNIENEPTDQGFMEEAYDLVVSSNCLHATEYLHETLRHCRKLLRPGGRLVLLEITKDFLPTQLVMSTLPGWFRGMNDGRIWTPTVGLKRWDELLKANGFSGVDVSSTPSFCSVIISQAVDKTILTLREPLAMVSADNTLVGDIVIVGYGVIANLASETQAVLRAVSTKVTVVASLEGVQVPRQASVLCLNDLDSPIFREMNEARFRGLQEVMEKAKSLLWVTKGAKSGNSPEANITIGLSSTLRAERMDFRLQFLDVDDLSSLNPSMLAEMLLRLALVDPSEPGDMLWTQEPELVLKNGAIYIPRVLSLVKINRRSAARIRNIADRTSLKSDSTAVILSKYQGGFELEAVPVWNAKEEELDLQVTASSLFPLTCDGDAQLFACIGRELVSGDKILALSSINGSRVEVGGDRLLFRWQDNKSDGDAAAQLHQFLVRVLAARLLGGLEGSVWVHGAAEKIREAIDEVARDQGIAIYQSTSDRSRTSGVDFIHPYLREEDLQKMRPGKAKSFINLAGEQNGALIALIQRTWPDMTYVSGAADDLDSGLDLIELQTLAKKFQPSLQDCSEGVAVTGIDQISSLKIEDASPTAVVDWTTNDIVSTSVIALEHRGLFSSDKTYLLCGMTGDLGVSVCLWMIENGARNIVLTSRNPNISPAVSEYLARKGANVRLMAVDLVDMESLRSACAEITSTMPVIGGVMNAAMILRDRLFQHLSWDDFYATLAPKVVGSRNLDELFGEEQLDFFICFSSTTSIVGSIGQSAYAAANHYMVIPVQGRRQRGLAGSVVHIAILTGFGYIFRRDADHAETINKAILPRFDRQSETDLHEMLAEAVVCGRAGSGQPAELITGIRTTFQGEWRDDPRLSCYSGQQQAQDDTSTQHNTGAISVQSQLAVAEDHAECHAILEQRFGVALGSMLEIKPETLDSKLPVANLGIDSLVAIRIREWFLKEMGVDVPVLKVMSDKYTMSRMCDDVLVDWRKNTKT